MSKSQLGNFGLGAKSLLATGVDFYTVTSRYNGREYSFNIYKDHILSDISRFNENGTENKLEVFFEGDEDKEYSCYYRETKELNGVTIESEVKRHRKMDFISGVENQLGFIENVELLVKYKRDGHPAKRHIQNTVVYETDKILVGESSYYAVPQIILKPGADSDIKICYGTINFEELEMPKYSGNVSFILNINDVDVPPSREAVIWSTKTREAVKNCFITAQETITDMIQDKVKEADNLPDFMHLVNTFKTNTSIEGMSELYKIVDVSKIDNTFKTFKMHEAALILNNEGIKKNFIFTSTENVGSYYNKVYKDVNYTSYLTKDYLSAMSTKSSEKVIMYIGDVKYKKLASYIANQYDLSNSIRMIYIKPEKFNKLEEQVEEVGIEKYLYEAYVKKDHHSILLGEVYRFYLNNKHLVLLEDDVNVTEMNKIAKEADDAKSKGYMTPAERAKAENKIPVQKHFNSKGVRRYYYNQKMMVADKAIIYSVSDDDFRNVIINSRSNSLPESTVILGLSAENFKEFYKVPGIRVLYNELFTIKFGDLEFTEIGKAFFDYRAERELLNLYYANTKTRKEPVIDGSFKYLKDTFRSFKLKNSIFTQAVDNNTHTIKRKRKKYIDKDRKAREKESLMNINNNN